MLNVAMIKSFHRKFIKFNFAKRVIIYRYTKGRNWHINTERTVKERKSRVFGCK
jgi:hypothetical protein